MVLPHGLSLNYILLPRPFMYLLQQQSVQVSQCRIVNRHLKNVLGSQ